MIETIEILEAEACFEKCIDIIIDRYGANRQFNLAILHDIQKEYSYLPREALEQTARRLAISRGEIYRLATFFTSFSLLPKGQYETKVCLGTACHVQGGQRILEQLERELDLESGQTTPDCKFSIESVRCVGACALAPVIMVNEDIHGQMSVTKVSKLLKRLSKEKE
jgi:NADH:ubiquinone oxidoreductase subunit E